MKKIAIIPLSILLTLIITACATPTASPALTSIPTRTPTILPTETAPEPTATLTQTDTVEPTETPEPTPTPEAQLLPTPEVSLPERIASLDNLPDDSLNEPQANKESLSREMIGRFPLEKEDGSWSMLCIAGDIITHEPTIKLPTGKEISHTFACQYQDAEGQDQEVHFPIFTYDLEEDTYMGLGYKATVVDNVDNADEVILAYSDGHDAPQSPGNIDKLCRRGWSGPEPGHVFTLYFAYPKADSENYLAPDIQGLSPDLAKFAQTGDPSLLAVEVGGKQIALLLPDGDTGASFDNVWGAEQKENSGPVLD